MGKKRLTSKEEIFCQFYAELGNASNAYREAYSCKNMKPATITNNAYNLLKKSDISARIEEIRSEINERSMLKKEDAVRELANIVNARITGIGDIKEGKFIMKDLNGLPDSVVSCIQSVRNLRDGGIEVKLYDKISAIDRLSKMLGWDEPTNTNANVNFVIGDEQ